MLNKYGGGEGAGEELSCGSIYAGLASASFLEGVVRASIINTTG
jgi:hypothetical protein